jgi:copper chaperone CopZ
VYSVFDCSSLINDDFEAKVFRTFVSIIVIPCFNSINLLIFNTINMKTIKFVIAALMAVLPGINTNAQMHDHSPMVATKTESIKVSGNCDLCKARIEKAAKVDGVSKAEWNKNTKVLTLVYNPAIVTSDAVQKKIASVGHDTEKFKADDKVYNSLPGCCKYERTK